MPGAWRPSAGPSPFSAAFPPVVVTPPPPFAPYATGIVSLKQSKKGLMTITIGFNEALSAASADNPGLYSVLGAVKKKKKTVYTKVVKIKSAVYNGLTQVTINLAKPYKGAAQVTVRAGIVAANGASSASSFSTIVA